MKPSSIGNVLGPNRRPRCWAGALFLLAAILLLPGCRKHQQPRKIRELPAELQDLPEDFKPVYWIEREEDYSYRPKKGLHRAKIERKVWRMTLPLGMAQPKAYLNVKHALRALHLKHRSASIVVFVYEKGHNLQGPFTVARAEIENNVLRVEWRPPSTLAPQDS